MRIVSPLLKRVVYPTLSKSGILRLTAGKGVAVVTYHGIFPSGYEPIDAGLDGNLVTAENFRRQLRLLKAKYDVISPEDLLAWCEKKIELPPRAVLLTCDDGLVNNVTDMLPLLQEEGLRCLFFVTGLSAGDDTEMLWYEELFLILIDAAAGPLEARGPDIEICGNLRTQEERRAIWWSAVQQLSRVNWETRRAFIHQLQVDLGCKDSGKAMLTRGDAWRRRFLLMMQADLQSLRAGGMTIGAHTVTHPRLSCSTPALAESEIRECKALIETAIGDRVWAFAYPFGDPESVSAEVLGMPEAAGYEMACLNFGGGLSATLPRFALPRINVTSTMSLGELEAHVAGFYTTLQRVTQRETSAATVAVDD
jgi:peptidoglycan/xylan/chitin deacetylase (PgdA/CDA1 family)